MTTFTADPFTRPTLFDVRMEMARTLARRSLCVRSKVGAIITAPDGRIEGEGYNGPPAGFHHGSQPCNIWCKRSSSAPAPAPDYSDCPSIHAEANALLMSDRSKRLGGSIYITSHICFGCAKLIANSGLQYVFVETAEEDAHRDPRASYIFLLQCGLDVAVYAPGFHAKDQLYGPGGWQNAIYGNRS